MKLSGLLLTDNSDKEIIDFKNGCVVCLEKEEGKWSIEWMVTPQILRQEHNI